MPINYNGLRKTTARLLRDNGVHKTGGTVEIGRPVSVPGANPYDPPNVTTSWTPLDAVVTGVSQKYVDGSNVVMSDRMVMCQTLEFDEVAGDRLRIDGKVVAILSVMPVLAAGEAVLDRFIVR